MLRILAITSLMLAGISTVALADVYRTKDAKGNWQYTDRWTPGSEVVKGEAPRPNNPEPAAEEPSTATRAAVAGDRVDAELQQERDERAVKQDVAQAREKMCKEAKDGYQKAIQARRIYRSDKAGEREFMTDAEADQYRLDARTAMQDACGLSK